MSLDFSEIMIGAPGEVMARLSPRLGELNFASANLKLGVSDDPQRVWRGQGGEEAWPLLKLLYLTHSLAQAREMAGLLRAWDAKLFLREDQDGGLGQGLGGGLGEEATARPQREPARPRLVRSSPTRPALPGAPGPRAPGRDAASFYAFALIR
jgi:hypothetical protein